MAVIVGYRELIYSFEKLLLRAIEFIRQNRTKPRTVFKYFRILNHVWPRFRMIKNINIIFTY